jgi:hypothetical protein
METACFSEIFVSYLSIVYTELLPRRPTSELGVLLLCIPLQNVVMYGAFVSELELLTELGIVDWL